MWTVGLSLSGNEVGYSVQEFASAPEQEVEARVAVAEAKLKRPEPITWCAAWPICRLCWCRSRPRCVPEKCRSRTRFGSLQTRLQARPE
jgi:hypothetical protein